METFDELYYTEPWMRRFTAKVASCEKQEDGFAIQLDRTAFYPEGGGQPGDRGTLVLAAASGNEEDAVAVHVRAAMPGEEPGCVLHLADAALPVGAKVEGILDWTWRRDNMEAHTGEHIVSGIVHSLYGYDNIGFHMGERFIEVDFDGTITADQAREVEQRANEAVREDVPVEALLPSPAELEEMDYRSKKDHDGQIRIVRIPGVDSCACCGTHLASTGQVGLIKIFRVTTKKKKSRLEILCGRRALEATEALLDGLRETSNFLSVADEEVEDAVRRLAAEKDGLRHELREAARQKIAQEASTLAPEGRLLVHAMEGLGTDELRYLAECVLAKTDATICAALSPANERISYVIASADTDLRPACKELNRRLAGRGGGKPQMVQGSWEASPKAAEAAIRELLG